MANEDKFLKEIDDVELDEVAGGATKDFKKDIKFLKAIGEKFGKKVSDVDVENAWRNVGITVRQDWYTEEMEYAIKGDNFVKDYHTRQDAMIMAMRKTGRVVNLDDYL